MDTGVPSLNTSITETLRTYIWVNWRNIIKQFSGWKQAALASFGFAESEWRAWIDQKHILFFWHPPSKYASHYGAAMIVILFSLWLNIDYFDSYDS